MKGYKVFNKGMTNRYGQKFQEHTLYTLDTSNRKLKYGNSGYGFHFARRLEDCLRYFDGLNEEIDIALVYSLGDLVEGFDDYYEYYELYATDKLYVDHVLSRKEIMEYATNTSIFGVGRIIQGYKLTEEEKQLISLTYNDPSVDNAIEYYQNHNEDVYQKTKILERVNK